MVMYIDLLNMVSYVDLSMSDDHLQIIYYGIAKNSLEISPKLYNVQHQSGFAYKFGVFYPCFLVRQQHTKWLIMQAVHGP